MNGRRRLGDFRNVRNSARGRDSRSQLQPPFDDFSPDIEDLFETLALGSRFRLENATQMGYFLRPRQPRRSQDANGRLSARANALARLSNPEPRVRWNEMARRVLPLGRAMRRLSEQLIRAQKFYSRFQGDYDADVDSIMKYANTEILNELWTLRINGKRDPKTVFEGDDNDDDEALRELKGDFEDMKRDIKDALECAVESTILADAYESAHFDSVKRMRIKIETASEQILELLDVVRRGREACVALLSELDLLKALIDPNLEITKECTAFVMTQLRMEALWPRIGEPSWAG